MRRTVIAIACIILATWALSACAGPIQSELASYRCIVPDWSKTSGGHSPAISPDGDILAYLANGKVWIVSGLNAYRPTSQDTPMTAAPPEAWQLDVKVPDLAFHPALKSFTDPDDVRNTEWSPDGKQLAFIFDGRLFVAESIDPKTKTASIRMLADMTRVSEEELKKKLVKSPNADLKANQEGLPLSTPRWSPDGTRIAFVRVTRLAATVIAEVRLLDVTSGEETVVADDPIGSGNVWEQPWSPDGKSLVYAAMKSVGGDQPGTSSGIKSVSLGDGRSRVIVDKSEAYRPSRSPTGDHIAYLAPCEEKRGLETTLSFPGVYTADSRGANPKPIPKSTPSKDELAKAIVEMRDQLQTVLRDRYSGVYSAAQLKRFASAKLTDRDVAHIITVAELVSQAKGIGGDFQTKIEKTMKAFNAKGSSFDIGKDVPYVEVQNAVNVLPMEQKTDVLMALIPAILGSARPMLGLTAEMDRSFVWSPDGQTLAFVRCNSTGTARLMTMDIRTGDIRTLFDESTIESPVWTRGGRSVVVQSSRNMVCERLDEDESDWFPRFRTIQGYPEIWILDLK